MSTMTITNDTKLPLHTATEWDGIVQEFKNYVKPGETVNLPAAGSGWQDLVVITGMKDSEVSHKDDWSRALSFGLLIGGVLTTIAGTALTIVTLGAAAPVVIGGISMTAGAVVASSVVVLVGGLVVTLGSASVEIGGRFNLRPSTVTGLWGPHGYTFRVTGGEIRGGYDKAKDQFIVSEVTPLIVEWKNKTTDSHGIVGQTT